MFEAYPRWERQQKTPFFFLSQVNFRTLMSWGFLDDFMVTSKHHWETNKQAWFWTQFSSWKYVFNLMFLYFPLFCSFKSHRSRPCWSLSQVPKKAGQRMWPSHFPYRIFFMFTKQHNLSYPRCSMYGIFSYIYHKNQPNVGKYTIHGSYGYQIHVFSYDFVFIRRNPPFRKLRSHDKHPGGVQILEPQRFSPYEIMGT